MLGYNSTIVKNRTSTNFEKLHFLIGEYDVLAYNSLESSAWIRAGRGEASYSLSNAFITENVEIHKKGSIISMHNRIGSCSEKETFNMQTLDYGSGEMDVYKGSILNEKLVFCNSNSNIKMTNEFGNSFNFKLIYKQLSSIENELIVGCSKDNGRTWFPYIKNIYTRK